MAHKQSNFEVEQQPTEAAVPTELKDAIVTAQGRKTIFL